jgi:hypothetical protein
MSPRLVVLPVFDVNLYESTRLSLSPTIKIVNLVGFFIASATDTQIVGHLAIHPGELVPSKPQILTISSFLWSAVLYR